MTERERAAGDEIAAFPEAVWRGPFCDYREAMAGVSEAADAVFFASLWAATAVRLRRRVCMHYAYDLFANVYLVTVGTTGDAKKTTGMRTGSGLLPLRGVKVLRGVGSAEALADWMQQPEDAPPVAHLLLLEELSPLLTRGRWDGSTLISYLTESYDAPDVHEIPFRKNPIRVVEPTPSLLAGTTTEWLWRSLREEDCRGGFGNRLCFIAAAPKEPISRPGRPEPRAFQRVRDALDELEHLTPRELTWSTGAALIWDTFYASYKWVVRDFDPLAAALAKRVDVYALKLAMVYAAFEATPSITEDQMTAAVMFGSYQLDVICWLVAQKRAPSRQHDCEQAVLRALAHSRQPKWKIHQAISGRFSAMELDAAIRSLLSMQMISEDGTTKRGERLLVRRGEA